MDVTFGPLTEEDARAVLAWRYDPPYDTYNADPDEADANLATLLDPANRYFGARDAGGTLVGYCCYGPDARVGGGDYTDPGPVDVGLGLRPDRTGRGAGLAFVLAVLDFGRRRLGVPRYRLTVAAFNERAMRVYERAGFRAARRFRRGGAPGGVEFVIMVEGG